MPIYTYFKLEVKFMYERAVKGIVLDSGHGGNDPGANANGTSDETLSPTNRVDRVLDAFGNGKDVIVISNHINAGGGDSHCVTNV